MHPLNLQALCPSLENSGLSHSQRHARSNNINTLAFRGGTEEKLTDRQTSALFIDVSKFAYKSCIGRLYLAKPYSAKSESAVQESGKPYFAKPGNC